MHILIYTYTTFYYYYYILCFVAAGVAVVDHISVVSLERGVVNAIGYLATQNEHF